MKDGEVENVYGRLEYVYSELARPCGLTGKDYYQKHSCSYEEFFKVVKHLTKSMPEVVKAFRIAVFNIEG
ncbi:MAG: hypothetical protein KAG61_01675 [Bacteriovoracaceae bacterium]|nr:hypothetical protein [Bacteriovoracaceae bacterium]